MFGKQQQIKNKPVENQKQLKILLFCVVTGEIEVNIVLNSLYTMQYNLYTQCKLKTLKI